MKRFNRSNDRFTKWGDARVSFKSLTTLSELATRFIHENHPLFAQATVCGTSKTSLVSNASSEKLAEPEEPQPRKGRQRKSNRFYEDYEQDTAVIIQKKRILEETEIFPDDGQRRKRNVGVPRHFENMVMIEHKRKKVESREEEDNGSVNTVDNDDDHPKRKRGRPLKSRDSMEQVEEAGYSNAASHTEQLHQQEQSVGGAATACGASNIEMVMTVPKRLTFPEFCDQMQDFFRVLGAWYGVAAPIILHYLREQILPVLRVLSSTQLPRATIEELFDQISRTLSYRGIAPSFLSLLAIGRGFPFYAALVYTLRIYDPENLYGMRSMHYFVEPPPIQVITIYLRKVVEALNQPDGRDVFRRIATLMDEVVTEWKDYSIPLEKRLEKIVRIDQLLPEHCRGLRARLYHVLMLPSTIMSKTLLQQQQLDESHVISTADGMIGPADAKRLERLGYDSLRETGIVPSNAPNTVLFNNVAYIKPVTIHPGLQSAVSLGVHDRLEPPVPVVNRMYSSYPQVASGPMFYVTGAGSFSTSFASVPVASSASTALAPNVYADHSSKNSQARRPSMAPIQKSKQLNGAPYPTNGVYSNGQNMQSNGNAQMTPGNMQPLVSNSTQAAPDSSISQSSTHPSVIPQQQAQLNGSSQNAATSFPQLVNGGAPAASYTGGGAQFGPNPPPVHAYSGGSTYVLNDNYMTASNGTTSQPVRRYTYIPAQEFDSNYAQFMRSSSSNILAPSSKQASTEKIATNKGSISSLPVAASSSSSSSSSSDVAARLQALSTGLVDTSQKREEAAIMEKRFSDEATRVKMFLEKANGVVAEKFIGPFLLAVRELVRRLRAGETAKDDIDARIYLLHSFVPPENTEFRDEISSIFTPQNITPMPGRPYMNPASVLPFPGRDAETRDAAATTGTVTKGCLRSSSAGDGVEKGVTESERASESNTRATSSSTDPKEGADSSVSMPKLPSIREMGVHTTSGLPDYGLLRRHMDTTATTVGPVLQDASHSGAPVIAEEGQVAESTQNPPPQPPVLTATTQSPIVQFSQPVHSQGVNAQPLPQLPALQTTQPLQHQQSWQNAQRPGQQQTAVEYNTAYYRYPPPALPLSLTQQGFSNRPYQPPAPLPLSVLQLSDQQPIPPAAPQNTNTSHAVSVGPGVANFSAAPAPDSSEPPPFQLAHVPAGSSVFQLTNCSIPALSADTALFQDQALSAMHSLYPHSASSVLPAMVPSASYLQSKKGKRNKRTSLNARTSSASTAPVNSAAAISAPFATEANLPEKIRRNSGQSSSVAQEPAVLRGLPEEIRIHPTKPVIINGITFPFVAPFPIPVETTQDSSITDTIPGGHSVDSTQSTSNGQKASLAAGPMIAGEDKQLQLSKALAYYFDLQGTNYELSITVLSEKFRVSQGKIKAALTKVIEERIASWSDELCVRLDEVLETFKQESSMSLARAAEFHCVPYVFALIWFLKGKASVNRHRTKPADFKMKLREMFVAYFKAEEEGLPASRAAIARRFDLAPAVFSRKLVDLTEEQRQEYIDTARQLLKEEKSDTSSMTDIADPTIPAASISADSVLQEGENRETL